MHSNRAPSATFSHGHRHRHRGLHRHRHRHRHRGRDSVGPRSGLGRTAVGTRSDRGQRRSHDVTPLPSPYWYCRAHMLSPCCRALPGVFYIFSVYIIYFLFSVCSERYNRQRLIAYRAFFPKRQGHNQPFNQTTNQGYHTNLPSRHHHPSLHRHRPHRQPHHH